MMQYSNIDLKRVYTLNELIALSFKIVRLQGNRDINQKT